MTLRSSFTTLSLLGTFLSQQTMAMDEPAKETIGMYAMGLSPTLNAALPVDNIITDCGKKVAAGVGRRVSADLNFLKDVSTEVLMNRDLGILAGLVFEKYMTTASRNIIGEIFRKKPGSYDEFDIEALRPIVAKLRSMISERILNAITGTGTYVNIPGYGPSRIYEDKSIFRKFLEATIPDCILGKKGLIYAVDLPIIRNYLAYKVDEMIINSLLSLYKKSTSRTLKHTARDFINQLTRTDQLTKSKGKEKEEPAAPDAWLTAPAKWQEDPDLKEFCMIECKAVEEEDTEVWKYLAPRLHHYLRASLSTILKDATLSVIKDVGTFSLMSLFPKGSAFPLYATAGYAGFYYAGMAGGAVAGMAGGVVGLGGLYFGNLATEEVAQYLNTKVTENIDLLVNFYSFSLIPYSPQEHYLFHLNPNPSELESKTYASDYAAQQQMSQQYLVGSIIKDIRNKSFLARWFGPKDKKVLEEAQELAQPRKNTYGDQIKLGRILYRKKMNKRLTEEEKLLMANLVEFPSYAMKAQEIEIIKLWKNKETHQELKKKTAQLKQDGEKAEQKLQELYTLFGLKIPSIIAGSYQVITRHDVFDERYGLDFIEVEAIMAANVLEAIEGLSKSEIDLLTKSMSDDRFLLGYIEQFIDSRTAPGKVEFTEEETINLIKDPSFIACLPEVYCKYKYQEYISHHQKDLRLIKRSIYGFGLPFVDVVELHQRLSDEQLKKLSENFLMATLTYEEAFDQAKTAFRKPDLRADLTPEAREIYLELDTIDSCVKKLVEVNKSNIVNHFFNQFMERFDLNEFMKNALEAVPDESELNWKSVGTPDIDKATYQKLFGEAKDDWEVLYNRARVEAGWIKKNKLDDSKSPLRAKISHALKEHGLDSSLRSNVYLMISNAILKYLVRYHADPEETKDFCLITKEWGPFDAYTKIISTDKHDWTSYYLAESISKLQDEKQKKEKEMGEEQQKGKEKEEVEETFAYFPAVKPELIFALYQEIQAEKWETYSAEVRTFEGNFPLSLLIYKGTIKEYEGTVNYSLQEIYDHLQKAKIKPQLEAIYNQPKRKDLCP